MPERPGILALISLLRRSYAANAGVFAALIVMAAFVLNCPGILIERTTIVHRIADPALMLIGLIGSVFRIRFLRAVGWLGYVWFFPVVLFATPDLDHFTPELLGFPIFWRVSVTGSLCLALLIFFKVLALKRWDEQRHALARQVVAFSFGGK
ncbi:MULTISPECIES: hypothetical protein [Nitrospirillum]|uniref:hypothetical protein n=1 Tax=Nitrospirillum amazonense TaxID=28077 RepID=UPI0011A3EDEC|nr:hypothetical protein [Nitrospirillum amazonense]MEC4591327.1 hypothetical protein [Nitrospirillum amazonense]